MVNYIILTNNQQVAEYAESQGWNYQILFGLPIVVLMAAESLAIQGWRLAVDPLAGYFSHHNPYHTVFLQRGQASPHDWLCLERAANRWQGYKMSPAEKQLAVRQAYQQLDKALAISTMEQLAYYIC